MGRYNFQLLTLLERFIILEISKYTANHYTSEFGRFQKGGLKI